MFGGSMVISGNVDDKEVYCVSSERWYAGVWQVEGVCCV